MSTAGAAKISARRSAYRLGGTLGDVSASAGDKKAAKKYRQYVRELRSRSGTTEPSRHPLHEWRSKQLERFEQRIPVGSVVLSGWGEFGIVERVEQINRIHVRFGPVVPVLRADQIELVAKPCMSRVLPRGGV